MTAFSIVSFFQMTFIPGFIFLKFFRPKNTGLIGTVIYSFALSLLINYFLVYHLTLAGIYNPIAAYMILTIELALAIMLVLKKRFLVTGSLSLELSRGIRSFPGNIIPIISAALILGSLYFFFSDYPGVFTHWDAAFSWNRWAIDWYLNDIPDLTYLYPQLIPANWSLSYMMMQDSSIQLAAKSIMPLFVISIPVIFFDLYLKKRKQVFSVSVMVFSALVLLYSMIYIDSGYVDFASAFLSLAAFYAILNTDTDSPDTRDIIIVFLMASAAAAAKQAGFIILVFAVIWFIWLMVRNRKNLEKAGIIKNILSILLVMLLSLYWYLVKAVDIARGRDFSTLRFLLVDIYHDSGLWERFLNGLDSLRASPVPLIIIAVLSLVSLFDRRSRWFTLGITIPSFLLWSFFFSYDDRNIIMTFPFLAWSASAGVMFLLARTGAVRLIGRFSLRFPRLFKKRPAARIILWPRHVFFMLICSFILGLIFLAAVSGNLIKDIQFRKQKQIGDSSINEMLYDYQENNSIDGKIITDYYWVTVLPGFVGTNKRIFLENDRFIILSNSDSYELIDPNTLVDDKTHGFLISDMYFKDDELKNIFQSKIADGDYRLIFSKNGYHFFIINK